MQYPGNNYYPAEAATANPPSAFSSYNWASAPPYGESTAAAAAPAYYLPPEIPVHTFDPPNYGYNPHHSIMPSTYANHNATPVANPNFVANTNYVYDRGLPYPAPDTRGGYGNNNSFQYPSFGQRYYDASVGKETTGYDNSGFEVDDGGFGGEVYAYDGGRSEPYGARGTGRGTDSVSGSGAGSKPLTAFDDYGNLTNITKAVPKADTHDSGNGVQKYRVKILPDSGSQSSMDVLCQIGLDGIRMLDTSTTRTLRIYPLETITRWEVAADPSVYTFWAKSAVDIEPRRIRLQSNRYTTSTILDTVAAACVQFREMADDRSTSYLDTGKTSEQASDKKKGSFADWMTLKKPLEEKQHWVPDEAVTKCTSCGTDFGAFVRRHHCRNCGDIFCDKCTQGRIALTSDKDAQPVRVCDRCLAEVTQRLSTAKDKFNKSTTPQTHDDLAKRLLEEMGKTRKMNSDSGGNTGSSSLWSSEHNSDGSGKRTREVACPTCTVHLQVPVPRSGTETVECGVCQHPFLVSAR